MSRLLLIANVIFSLTLIHASYADGEIVDLLKLADSGNSDAQSLVGVAYLAGKSVPQNFSKAVTYLSRAAASGHQEAQLDLANCFDKGWGVPRSEPRSLWILRKLSNEGMTDAQRLLGLKLSARSSSLIESNHVQLRIEAYKWLSVAASKADKVAKDREQIRIEMSAKEVAIAQKMVDEFRVIPPAPLLFTNNWYIVPPKR